MVKFELSPFNINFNFKDREHIELLKKQIEAGYELPIEVYEEDGVYKIIDGGHSWVAYQELGREPKNVKVLTFRDDAEKIAYSRRKNINRLQQSPVAYTKSIFEELKLKLGAKTDQEVKRILRRLYNLKYHPDKYKPNEGDESNNNIIVTIFKGEPITWESFVMNNLDYLNFPLWLAEMVDRGEISASHAAVLNEKKVVEKFSDDQLKRLVKLAQAVSVDALRKGINELLEFEPEVFNVWNFRTCNPIFGKEGYPGRMPGQIVMNLLYYYTEEGDLVVDPFAGGGTTLDVCHFMNRRCVAFDLNPTRPDIKQNDAINGIPLDSESADFVLLDPPYSTMKKGEYTGHPNDLSNMDLNDFFKAMRKVFAESKRILKENKCCAFITSSLKQNGKFVDIAYSCYRIATEEGFAPTERIIVPYGGNESSAGEWVKIAKEKKLLLRGYRDLIIFRK